MQDISEKNQCLKLDAFLAVEISGSDRYNFLQALFTQDLESIDLGSFGWSCLLDSKSKLIALIGVERQYERTLLYIHSSKTAEVVKTLDMYTIIQDVSIKVLEEDVFVVVDLENKEATLALTPIATLKSNEIFEPLRLACGFPLPKIDYQNNLPLEVGFFHQAISMTKGCYVGQETIARLYARGMNVSQKLVHISCSHKVLAGDSVFGVNSDEVGKVSSAAIFNNQYFGLVWVKRKGFDQVLRINDQDITVLPYPVVHMGLNV